MLRLMNIQPVREHVYLVTLDRDGTVTQYEFTWNPPPASRPGLSPTLRYPPEVVRDLIDYQTFAPPGQPQGALTIPPLDDGIIQYVYEVADGKTFEFPIVLDER